MLLNPFINPNFTKSQKMDFHKIESPFLYLYHYSSESILKEILDTGKFQTE